LAFAVSFIPPSSLPGTHADEMYAELLIVCFALVFVLPFIVYLFRNKNSKKQVPDLVLVKADNAPPGHFFIHPKARSTHYPKW
ncbi:MAG: glutamate:gamma-aminobutyrate antiporter, partial [Hafnia sp.]